MPWRTKEDAFLPTELIVLTTSMGRLGFESDLVDENNGRLWELYKASEIEFG